MLNKFVAWIQWWWSNIYVNQISEQNEDFVYA